MKKRKPTAWQFDWREESIKTRIETKSHLYQIDMRLIEEKNPLKQGLKLVIHVSGFSFSNIEEKNPLKQGLKRAISAWAEHDTMYWREESIKTRIETISWCSGGRCRRDWREESIKTRIETIIHHIVSFRLDYWREESIKTRIETGPSEPDLSKLRTIEEKNPLKQGLKQGDPDSKPQPIKIEEKNPLKQGLKLFVFFW